LTENRTACYTVKRYKSIKKGDARRMINMAKVRGKAFSTKSDGVDFDSRSAPAHR